MWRLETVDAPVLEVLGALGQQGLASGFYLAGGTGLALWLGHRRSRDLDLFHAQRFDEETLLVRLAGLPGFNLASKSRHTLHIALRGTRVSFLAYPYPLLFEPQTLEGVEVADPRDIACMKINAVAGRGSKRDFVDVYAAAQIYGLPALVEMFRRKYAALNVSLAHVLKSLTWFADAEAEPMPDMLAGFSWDQVKTFFRQSAPLLL